MTQARRYSLLESITNVVVGYSIGVAAQMVVFPLLDIPVSVSENLIIAGFMTVVSLIRSYMLRRLFNWINR